MAQGPDTLRKELAFFRRLLIRQERELQDISKKADQREQSKETLDACIRTRKTRRTIDGIEAQMSKRGITYQDSDGIIGRPGGGDTAGTRPPDHPPPPLPPLPIESLQRARVGATDAQSTTSSLRCVRRRKHCDTKEEGDARPSNIRPPTVRSLKPTEIPSFDPRVTPPERSGCV